MYNRNIQILLLTAVFITIGSLVALDRPTRSLTVLEEQLGTSLESTRKNVSVEFESSAGTSGVIRIDNDEDIQLILRLSDERAEFRRVGDQDYFDNLSSDGWATYTEDADLISTTRSTVSLEGITGDEDIIELDPAECSTGTCRVYQITRIDDSKTVARIDAETNTISELEGEVDGNTVKFTYLERDPSIDIEAPEDFIETLDDQSAAPSGS